MKTTLVKMLVLGLVLVVCRTKLGHAESMGNGFTYQDWLIDDNKPVDGLYDFQFKLFDDASDGNQVGCDVNIPDVYVIDGHYTVFLDFGSDIFNGDARWLEIGVRDVELNDPNEYTILSPRQFISPAPYALYAESGPPGQQGPKGDKGDTGPMGPQGPKGDQGNTGPMGPAGPQGPKGDQGSVGLMGPAGPQGPQGPKGNQGDVGLMGPEGPKGDKGDTGAIGPQGPKGDTGATGPQGPMGPIGLQGSAGPTLGIYDSLGLSSSGGLAAGDAGYRRIFKLASLSADSIRADCRSGSAIVATSESGNGIHAASSSGYAGYFEGSVYILYNIDIGGSAWVDGALTIGDSVYVPDGTVYCVDLDVAGRASVAGDLSADNLNIAGYLSKGSGSFKIDHPLDPENKFLQHSFVESPDMMNIYNGNVSLDEKGEATVTLPEWFEKLNKDFRYQLTAIGAPGPNLYVAEKISNNRFRIAGGKADMEVSWQVTGVRQDPYAVANRIVVEEDKPEYAKGYYLHPEAYGLPKDRSIANAPKLKPSKEQRVVAKDADAPKISAFAAASAE